MPTYFSFWFSFWRNSSKLISTHLCDWARYYDDIFVQRAPIKFIFWKSKRLLLILCFLISSKFLCEFCIIRLFSHYIFRKRIVVLSSNINCSPVFSIVWFLKGYQSMLIGIKVMAVAVKQGKLEGLRSLSQLKPILYFMVIFEVRCFLQSTLQKFILVDIICWSKLFGDSLHPDFLWRQSCCVAVTVVRNFFFKRVTDSFKEFFHVITACIDTNNTWFNEIKSLLASRLVNGIVGWKKSML